jgi:hypothetical protein
MKVLANKVLEFSNGIDTAITEIGFCSLPDWVADTDYFKMAVIDGSVKGFESSSDKSMEEVLKKEENYQKQIEELKAELDTLKASKVDEGDSEDKAEFPSFVPPTPPPTRLVNESKPVTKKK